MVRTGARAEVLADILEEGGCSRGPAPSSPRLSTLPAELAAEVLRTYRNLGGVLAAPNPRPGGWDMALEDGPIIELDEELHFNRYRLMTLDASGYSGRAWAEEYRQHCIAHEDECLAAGRWGKRWTNESCAAMFGSAAEAGEFDGAGAPRWKQRALYDALKDAATLADERVGGVATCRMRCVQGSLAAAAPHNETPVGAGV